MKSTSHHSDPLVSVVIPAYNREKFVDEAIESVLAQDYDSFELVLVDDGSTDTTPELLKRWADKDQRVVLVTAPTNEGISAALNRGLAHSRGHYIARLDSDDVMLPGRISAQVKLLEQRPDVILATAPFEYMDAEGKYISTWQATEPHEVVVFLLNFFNIVAGHGQVMYRKADVMKEGGYSLQHVSSEDYDLWVKLLQRGRIERVSVLGMRQRIHGNQSPQQYAGIKRRNWHSIMGSSLRSYLRREVSSEEIDALITLWRLDGKPGMSTLANAISKEAFQHFCENNPKALQRLASGRVAQQWKHAAGYFTTAGMKDEAAAYARCAEEWFEISNSGSGLRQWFSKMKRAWQGK